MFLIVHFILLASGFSARGDSFQGLAENPQWVRSLHYKSDWGKPKHATKIDGFYLSSEASAEKELRANIEAAKKDRNYQCRFPFRTKILKRAKQIDAKNIFCPDLHNWKSAFDKQELSLAFASQYLSNPASVFGHTFLVFSPTDRSEHPEYLDVTIGYAAEMPPKVGTIRYIVDGLGGGFQGRFFDEPYYQRLQEYSNMELRDLWQYPIKATPQQIDDLLDHIYELSHKNYFDYYFLDENCSYMLLQIFEVIFPRTELIDDFKTYVMPIETIKTLERHNLLGKGVFLPSLRTIFLADYSQLSAKEKTAVKKTLKGRLDSLNSKESADTVIAYFDKKKFATKNISVDDQSIYQKVLLKRSQMGPRMNRPSARSTLDPVKSHHPHAITLGSGNRRGNQFQDLEIRPAVHDLLDLGNGHIKHSQIRLLTPTLRRNDNGGMTLQKFQILSMANIVPYHALDPIFSWTLLLEQNRLLDRACFDCSATRLKAEIGQSINLTEFLDFYILPGAQGDVSKDLINGYRIGVGIHTGLILDFVERVKLNPNLSYYYADRIGRFSNGLRRIGFDGSYNITQSFAVRASYQEVQLIPSSLNSHEAAFSLTYFFR